MAHHTSSTIRHFRPEEHDSEISLILSNDTSNHGFNNPTQEDLIHGDDHEVDFFSIGLFFGLALLVIVIWYRKKRYVQRGIHKKN